MKKNIKSVIALSATIASTVAPFATTVASADNVWAHPSQTSTLATPHKTFAAQSLLGRRSIRVKIGSTWNKMYIPKESQTHNYGVTYSNAGCTEDATANAMKMAGIIQGSKNQSVAEYANALWNVQTSLTANQSTYDNRQSLGAVGDYAPVSVTKANSVIKRTNTKYKVFDGNESFTVAKSLYFGWGHSKAKGVKVANAIKKYTDAGYFIVILNQSNGHSHQADHATTIYNMPKNFKYGKNLNLIDSYQLSSSYFLTQRLSATAKMKWTYKIVAYKATDINGVKINSNYTNVK